MASLNGRGQWPAVSRRLMLALLGVVFTSTPILGNHHRFAASMASAPSSSFGNDLAFLPNSNSGGQLLDSYLQARLNDSCSEIWCETTDPTYYDEEEDFDEDEYLFGGHRRGSKGFWLDAPPDDILFMPPPPMPPGFAASLENESLKEFVISDDPEEGPRCNFCKIFADLKGSADGGMEGIDESIYSAGQSKDNDTFVSSVYLLIFSILILTVVLLIALVKYKKWKIFPVSESCPILSPVLGHHKSSSGSSSGHPPSVPVVNEKSPQSIIMDSVGKKATISTWKRMPNAHHHHHHGGANLFSMEDRGSCTSSPVYAELDPSVAGSCYTPTLIGPPGSGGGSVVSSFSPYAFSSSNTYSEVPDLQGSALRGHLGHHHHSNHHHHGMSPSPLLTDSSTYYSTKSLRRLAALNASSGSQGQVSMPLLAESQAINPRYGYPYHLQSTPINSGGGHEIGHGHFLTGGRPLKKPRPAGGHHPGQHSQQQQQVPYGYRTGPRHGPAMNHYVTQEQEQMILASQQQAVGYGVAGGGPFSAYLDSSSNGSNRKSSSSSQYTEMPLLQNTTMSSFNTTGGGGGGYRMPETCSANDLNSAASSSSGASAAGNGITNSTSSANSSASLKRPLPPVPGGGHVRL